MNKTLIQSECITIIKKYRICTIALSMGTGKTLLGLKYILEELKINPDAKILIVYPSRSIKQSWFDQIVEHNIDPFILNNIEFTTYLSLNKKNPDDYTHLVLDEVHSLKYSHIKFLDPFNKSLKKILGLTGSPPRNINSEKGKMIHTFCPIVYKYAVKDAIKDGILNKCRIVIHKLPLNVSKNIKISTSKGQVFFTSEKDNYNYLYDQYQKADNPISRKKLSIIILNALKKYKTKEFYVKKLLDDFEGGKCIVFVNTKEQADRIHKNSYYSGNPESENNFNKFIEGKENIIVCIEQLSQGINIKDLDMGIIMHSYGNERRSAQKAGRLLRLPVEYTSVLHVLCYANTIDEKWTMEAFKDFDPNKITYFNIQ